MVNVTKRIDELRTERGWSIYRLSNETGITQQAIHAWYNEGKKAVPSISTLEIVCSAFGITLANFFAEEQLIEITPQIKKHLDNWSMLSDNEKDLVESLIMVINKKKTAD